MQQVAPTLQNVDPVKKRTQLLCSFVMEGTSEAIGLKGTDARISKAIKEAIGEFDGRLGITSTISTLGGMPAQRILLAGLGKTISEDTFRFAAGRVALRAREIGVSEFSIIVPQVRASDTAVVATQIVQGARMSLFSFDEYKSNGAKKAPEFTLLAPSSAGIKRAVDNAEKVSDAVIFTKRIANLPPNDCTPATLASIAKIIDKSRIRCTIVQDTELKKRGFGGIIAVGQGSKNRPRLIILEYNGGKSREKPTVFVGKAVTFDTGGISLKPGEKMDEMKFDKCGGCTVLGIMKAVSRLGIRRNVVGIIPAVENMPGGESYRPGDIIKLYSGKTAEILNTDAEGRLILADALAFAEQTYSPKAVIDFATLTGACIVALGTNVAGMVTNDTSLGEEFKRASKSSAEAIWQLPLNDDYAEMIKSEVADIKNMGIGRAAGTITAAAFLKEAVEKTPWIHFDIAGVAWTQIATKEKPYNPKGATGFGVRMALDYLMYGQ